jgi:hypothetical protein
MKVQSARKGCRWSREKTPSPAVRGSGIGWPQTFACVDAIANSAVSDIRIVTNEGGIVSTNRFGAVVLSHSHEVGDLPEFLVAEKQSESEVNTK